jgi:hypothetical protein
MANEFKIKNGLYIEGLVTSSAVSNVLTYNTTTKQVYYTASSAIGGGGGGTGNGFPYNGTTTPAVITGSLLVSGSVTASIISASSGITGSLLGTATTASYVTGSIFTSTNPALSASYALSSSVSVTASFALNAAAATVSTSSLLTTASVSSNTITFTKGDGNTFPITVNTGSGGGGVTFPYTGSAIISGSLIITGSLLVSGASSLILTPSLTSTTTASAYFLITGSIQQIQTASVQTYGVNIAPTMIFTTGSQTQTAFRVSPFFTGSAAFTSSQSNIVADFGAVGVGTQFSVNDITSGSIYLVNDISGLPIIEALSDWTVNMYNYPTKIFQKTGSAIIITGSMSITGSLTMSPTSSFILPLTASSSPAIGSAYWSGSLLFIYNGTRYMSASFV